MSQVMGSQPEGRSWISPVLQESRRFRNMNIMEHADLVQAIMLNFPEIYDEPSASSMSKLVNGARQVQSA